MTNNNNDKIIWLCTLYHYTFEYDSFLLIVIEQYFLILKGVSKMCWKGLYKLWLVFADITGVSETEEYQWISVLSFLSSHITHFTQFMFNNLVFVIIKLNCCSFKQQFRCEYAFCNMHIFTKLDFKSLDRCFLHRYLYKSFENAIQVSSHNFWALFNFNMHLNSNFCPWINIFF